MQKETERRKIALDTVEAVLAAPDQIVPEHGNVTCYQSKVELGEKQYLIRVMLNETVQPAKVVTVYRTSKLGKYWKQK